MMSQFEPEEISFERERAILEEVQNNPNLHHNALIKSIVPKYMAKTTFERTKNRLIEKNILSVSQIGNKKFYSITENYQKSSLQLIERISHENYQSLQHEIKKIKEDYHHKDVNEKITTCVQLLIGFLQTDNEFTLLDAVKNPKKTLYKDEHQTIQEMISKVFKMINDDKDFEIIYPTVMSYIENTVSKIFQETK
jgi:hypothetical protein